jgi:hypothetical protein
MNEPTIHDIAKGTTGCGDDPFTDVWTDDGGADTADDFAIEREHVHDALCYGTGKFASELRCGQ